MTFAVQTIRTISVPAAVCCSVIKNTIFLSIPQPIFVNKRYGKIFVYRPLTPVKTAANATEPTDKPTPEVFLRPDLRMFEPYNKAILKIIEKYEDPNSKEYNSHQIGHRNMLTDAVLAFYQSGHKRQAQKIYTRLRQLYPRDEFKVRLAVFARNRLIEELKSLHIINARAIVQTLLRQSYFLYAIRDDNGAFGTENLAKEVYNHYHASYTPETRWDLPAFSLMRYFALVDFLQDRQYSLELRHTLYNRIKIERPDLAKELEREEEKLLKKQQ